jgi:uncharacterized protein (TIGR02246 family)
MPGDCTPTTATQEILARYLDAWTARDPDAIAALHTEDTTFVLRYGAAPVHGRSAVRAAFAQLFEQFPDFTADVERAYVGADHWVLDWTLTYLADPATGRRGSWDCLDLVVIAEDGLVGRKDTFVDASRPVAAGRDRTT